MERIRIKDIAKMADVSVGTVDRVIHGRSGVSESSRKRVEEILKQLDYQPNMYASALASNKKYAFACLLPQHQKGEYWTEVEAGIHNAVETYSDFNVAVQLSYYDPYDYHSFAEASGQILALEPDGVMFAPTVPQYTKPFTDELTLHNIPYIYIDSNIKEEPALSFKAYIIGEYLLKKEKKDFNLMGYDLLQRNVDCLKQGSIFFLIAQQPTLQGFDGIKALCEHLILKKEITRENFMPIDLLTKENIEFYYNK